MKLVACLLATASLTFGLLRVVNLAHGTFFLLGAYCGLSAWLFTGSFWAAVVAAAFGLSREALVRRLLEHQRYKAAAELLHDRETLRSAQFTRADASVAAAAGVLARSRRPEVPRSSR